VDALALFPASWLNGKRLLLSRRSNAKIAVFLYSVAKSLYQAPRDMPYSAVSVFQYHPHWLAGLDKEAFDA
jgi:hypothetical protein